jgi:hypothetical protein
MTEEHKLELLVDGLPYTVKVTPFEFNNQVRYQVSYNGGKEDIFVWDSEVKRLMPIDDASSTMPDDLSIAISNKIESGNY